MKLNFKSMLIAALAITTTLASCSKEDGGRDTGNGEDRAVQIKINRSAPGSRSVGGQVADDTPVVFTSGKLLFTNAVDDITFIVTINPGNAGYDSGTKTVGVEALENTGGQWITGVPGQSGKVYLIGNEPAGMSAPAVNTKVTTLLASVTSQWKTDGSVDNVTLWGGTTLTQYTGSGAEADQFEAVFNVKPIVARFEIGKITGGGDITDYQVDGIFIDNYYNSMYVNGVATTDLKNNGAVIARYATDGADGSYTTAMLGRVFDYDAGGLTAHAPGNAWAYNLLAPTSATPAMPSIVVRLSGVEVNGEAWPSPQFLTIKNFYSDAGTNNVDIDALSQGRIYVISNLEFTEENLTPEPHLKSKRVRVEVDILNWESSEMGYDFE